MIEANIVVLEGWNQVEIVCRNSSIILLFRILSVSIRKVFERQKVYPEVTSLGQVECAFWRFS
jgi:hypothetical protein